MRRAASRLLLQLEEITERRGADAEFREGTRLKILENERRDKYAIREWPGKCW